MPVERIYRIRCDRCGGYLPKPSAPPSVPAAIDPSATPVFTSEQDAVAAALRRGWSAYPLMCPRCNERAREATVTNKIAGLYISLAKALNALEEAGEEPSLNGIEFDGGSAGVSWDAETGRWTVVQA